MGEIREEVILVVHCPFCGKVSEITVDLGDYVDYESGESVQRAFPYLNPYEREALINGCCEECSRKMEDEEDEEEWEDFDDCDYEVGFDPYLGCFSDDC